MKEFFLKYKVVISAVLGLIMILAIFLTANGGKNKIPDNYIAVFNGGYGEVTYSTYVYKLKKGYKYINTTNTTVSWGSTERVQKITGKGKVKLTTDVFPIAEKNNAYSYVMMAGSDRAYTIEEFRAIFDTK